MKKYGIDRINKHVLQRQCQQRVNAAKQSEHAMWVNTNDYMRRAKKLCDESRRLQREVENATIIVHCVRPPMLDDRQYQFVFSMNVDALTYGLRGYAQDAPVSAGRVVHEAFDKAATEFIPVVQKAIQGSL